MGVLGPPASNSRKIIANRPRWPLRIPCPVPPIGLVLRKETRHCLEICCRRRLDFCLGVGEMEVGGRPEINVVGRSGRVSRHTPAEAILGMGRCLGLALLGITNLLRVGEVFTVAKAGPAKMSFQGQKSRAREDTQDVAPWASRWLGLITKKRERRGHKTDKASCFQTASNLEAHWVSMVTGTPVQHLRWHALRRGGAGELWSSGARGPILMLAGG